MSLIRNIALGYLAAVAVGTNAAAGQVAEEIPGTEVYRQHCSSCHQLSGAPVEAIERAMGLTMRHLGAPEVQEKDDAQLRRDTVEGIGRMRAFPDLSEEDVVAVVGYMRRLPEP